MNLLRHLQRNKALGKRLVMGLMETVAMTLTLQAQGGKNFGRLILADSLVGQRGALIFGGGTKFWGGTNFGGGLNFLGYQICGEGGSTPL